MFGRTMRATCALLLVVTQPLIVEAKPPPPPPPSRATSQAVAPAAPIAPSAPAAPANTPPRGTGLYITGIVLATVGVLGTVAGAITFARGKTGEETSLVTSGKVLLAIGIPSIAIGVPLMVVGERRRDRARAALTPTVGVNRTGWLLGVRVAF